LFSADTILGWYRKLVGQKYDGSANRKGGRPKVNKEIIDLVLRFKKENPQWGCGRIHKSKSRRNGTEAGSFGVVLAYFLGVSPVCRQCTARMSPVCFLFLAEKARITLLFASTYR
jgi:hypothetical protein